MCAYSDDHPRTDHEYDQRTPVSHRVPFCTQPVVFFSGRYLRKEGIVKSHTPPKPQARQKERHHAQFQMIGIKPIQPHTSRRPDVAKDPHEQFLFPGIVCEPAQQGADDDDREETRRQDVAVQLRVDELHP